MEPGQLGPVLASRMEGAAEGADSQRIDFLFIRLLLVMLDFIFQGRQSPDTKTMQFGTIIFSLLSLSTTSPIV